MKTSFLVVSLGLLANVATAQIAIPNYVRTYTQKPHTRGFYFQAPTVFVVTHLQVPDEQKAGKQMAAIYRLAKAPPTRIIPKTADTPVFYKAGVPSNQLIPVIPPAIFKKGEWFVVLGAAGSAATTSNSSYGPGSDFKSSVLGMPITLVRAGTQVNLEAKAGKGPIWGDPGFEVSRVRVFVAGHGRATTYRPGWCWAAPVCSAPFPWPMG